MTILSRPLLRYCVGVALCLCATAALFSVSLAASAFMPDDLPIGTVGQPAVTRLDVTSGKEFEFSIDFDAQNGSGNLHKYAITADGVILDKDIWPGGAAAAIDAQHYDTERHIVTMRSGRAIPFRWPLLSPAQQTALDPATAAQSGATISPVLDFIRGDRSGESPAPAGYRPRAGVLGDIIHATPVYCPAALCTTDTVFVGANDGMLHAIDAGTGKERFAYLPSMLIPKLPALTASPYRHRYFVDGALALRKIGARTILVGTLGAGGKGLFALDVTHAAPASESAATALVLWEITQETPGFENLGYTTAQPTLVRLKNGVSALVLANGSHNDATGHAVLYLVNPLTGEKIREIDTFHSGGSGSVARPNGLSSPAVWASQYDGKIDTAYAGDIDGQVWQFDLIHGSAKKLHTTEPAQSITTAPALMPHPLGGAMVTVVTGRLFTPDDAADRTQHYAYGLWDSAPSANVDLLEQTLTEATYHQASPAIRVRWASNYLPDWRAGHHKGWKTPLPIGGERLLGDGAFITRGVFQFVSTHPAANLHASGGTASGGENWWMQLNALTGGDVGRILFDLNGDRLLTVADQILADKLPRLPVGRHLGGGIRSQMLPLLIGNRMIYHANYSSQLLLTPGLPVRPLVAQGGGTPLPATSGRPEPRRGITPGGAVTGNTPSPSGETAPAETPGRINWREIQP